MRYVFIINPVAGKGNIQKRVAEDIHAFFENNPADYKVIYTECRGDARQKAKAEAEKGDRVKIFACGGEGTSFEVLNGIIGFENAVLGVIPCGSANDFLKFFGDKSAFLDIEKQVAAAAYSLDLIKAGENYCLNGCSVGMDAMVANDMTIFKGWPLVSGSLSYKLAIAKNFLNRLGVRIELSLDDNEPFSARCLFAVVANAPYYGGGYVGAPRAVPNDGRLDFTLVDVISRLRVPKFLSRYQKGTYEGLPYCHLKSCRAMEFKSEKPIPVNLDGEIVMLDRLRFEIVRNGVNFAVPDEFSDKLLINI